MVSGKGRRMEGSKGGRMEGRKGLGDGSIGKHCKLEKGTIGR